jgi:hypothetical protein
MVQFASGRKHRFDDDPTFPTVMYMFVAKRGRWHMTDFIGFLKRDAQSNAPDALYSLR